MPLVLLILGSIALTGCGGIGLERVSPAKFHREWEQSLPASGDSPLGEMAALMDQAAKQSARRPGAAIDLYLQVAERALPGALRGGPEASCYRHATGQAVALLHSRRKLPGSSEPSSYTVDYARGTGLFDPRLFDTVEFADAIRIKKLEVSAQDGLGAPLVCLIDDSLDHREDYPFLHEVGMGTAATAVVDFPAAGSARIHLFDTRHSDRGLFRGRSRVLATNFTAPLVALHERRQAKLIGLRGVMKPFSFYDEMGLYSIEVPDPEKIPVVFTHGLGSKPATWIPPYNALLGEKFFRENYQIYAFYYPSGLPPMYPAAGLREELFRLHRELKKRGAGRNADRVVLVGHSMGGLMTSFQLRDFRGSADQLFAKPLREVPLAPRSRQALTTLLETPPPRFVKRAVFIATPHRGSFVANNWLGRLGSSLARVPKELLQLQLGEAARSLTSFGRSLARDADPLDGIARLKAGNPVLEFLLQQPVAHGTPYHSIIGNRGEGGGLNRGDDPESSDGVVPYWSSYLDGAASEKVVPSNHSAHNHPEAIEELKRILRLHLQG